MSSYSPHIFTQFNGLGAASSVCLVNENITTLSQLSRLSEQRIVSILGKSATYVQNLIGAVKRLPCFEISFEIIKQNSEQAYIEVVCSMLNFNDLGENGGTLGLKNQLLFVAGDSKNNLMHYQRLK